jgi:hypothetical protein
MAFADWSSRDFSFFHDMAFSEIFNRSDFRGLDDDDIAYAEELFERGFLNLNISEDDRYEARIDFCDVMGYTIDFRTGAPIDFDWTTYREIYDGADA